MYIYKRGNTMNLRIWLMHLEQDDNFEKLYGILKKPLLLFILSIVKNYDNAEDLTEDVFVRILKYYRAYHPWMNPKTWIYTIGKNVAYTFLEKNKEYVYDDCDLEKELHKHNLVQGEDALVIEEYLSYLSDLERQIVVLHLFGGFSHFEIAKLCSMTHSQVRSKYSYALKKLRNKVEK